MAISLPLRINLISLVFASVVATVLTGLGGVFLHHQQMENAANRAYFAAEELAARAQRLLALEMRVEDFLNFEQQCAAVIQNNELLHEAALLDARGQLRYRSTPGPMATPLPTDLVETAHRSALAHGQASGEYVVLPILRGKDTLTAYAVVAIDTAAVLRSTLQRVAWLVLSAIALFALAVVLQQYIFWRAIGRPLGTLVQTADEIQPDHLSEFPVLPEQQDADDIGRLYGAFSRLMQRLMEARRQLLAHNEALEATVRERTVQLTEANEELARDIRRREQLEEELRTLANTDALTGLSNRAFVMSYLSKRVDHVRRYRSSPGVMLFDFDGFKAINDTHGHAAGDQVLKVMAHRLHSTCRQSDLVARLGGDEFLIVFEGFEDPAGVAILGERVIHLFEEPIDWNGVPLHLGVSIGAALFPAHGADRDTLLAQADLAMYDIKQRGGGFALAQAPAVTCTNICTPNTPNTTGAAAPAEAAEAVTP
jgi:diguanylate cyclase (GGDEF)-like protein